MRQQLENMANAGEYELTFADGFDDAILGLCEHFGERGHEYRVAYDAEKCIEILMKDLETDYEGAVEYFDFNVTGAYVGPSTPAFISRPIDC